jgi:hypothetical protein
MRHEARQVPAWLIFDVRQNRTSMKIIESSGATLPSRRQFKDPHSGATLPVSATSHTPQSFRTAIRADIGESEAYKEALRRGEIGLQRPMGANVAGTDFITAVRSGSTGITEIICTDVKTSEVGKFPAPKTVLPGSWRAEVDAAVSRLKIVVISTDFRGTELHSFPMPSRPADIQKLEKAIVDAKTRGHIRLRQLQANYSASGQGAISGW